MNKHVAVVTNFAAVEGRVLAEALKPVCFVVESSNTYPILSYVKLKLDGTTLTVTGTDLNVEVAADIDVIDCAGEWEACVSARVLMQIAKVAGSMSVRIEPRDSVETNHKGKPTTVAEVLVTLDQGEAIYTLYPLSPDSFPSMPGERGDKIEAFTNGQLPAMLNRVSSAMSTEETRYYLNGVCWSVGQWFAATDGHRLFKLNYSPDGGPMVQHIIPRKVVLLLSKFLAGADIAVYGVKERACLHFVSDGLTIRAKMIEGTYPDIERVIPKAEKVLHTLDLPAAAVTGALRRVTVLRSVRSGRAIRLFNSDGAVAMEVKNAEMGNVTAVLHGTVWPAGASDFGLNRDYLKDMVVTCADVVRIGITDPGAPVLISDNDDTLIRVQMPMRV